MRTLGKYLRETLRAFISRENGVAAVEFALVVPVMLAVYMGCSEAAAALTADRKVQSVAGAIGDLVARSNKTITEAQLEDYFLAATSIMTTYELSGLVQTVTAVSVSNTGVATIAWSVRYQDEDMTSTVPNRRVGDPYDLPAEMRAIASGQTVIAAEVDYSYEPLLGLVFREPLPLHRSGLFMPRFGGTITKK